MMKNCCLLVIATVAVVGCGSRQTPAVIDDNALAFSENPMQITSVRVQTSDVSRCSYLLTIDSVAAFLTCPHHPSDSVSLEKVRHYLSYFHNAEYESRAPQMATDARDSVLQRRAYSVETVNSDGVRRTLSVYYKPCNDTMDVLGRRIVADAHRCYVQCDTAPLMVAQWMTFDLLSPDCSYFMGQ
jgi:hypothetical protein